jgi:DNA-binding YbaB/EbfC family protein
MSAVQETLEDLVVEGVAADGMVKVKMDGNQKLLDINIDPAAQHEELDLLEDLILIAVNQAVIKSQDKAQKRMNVVTGNILGNIKLPGM